MVAAEAHIGSVAVIDLEGLVLFQRDGERPSDARTCLSSDSVGLPLKLIVPPNQKFPSSEAQQCSLLGAKQVPYTFFRHRFSARVLNVLSALHPGK
jgi:hypothetical protein